MNNIRKTILAIATLATAANLAAAPAAEKSAAEIAEAESLSIKLPAPKILARKFFSIMGRSSQNRQAEMELKMMAGIIGYPEFAGISPTDPLSVAFIKRGGKMSGYAELSADKDAPIMRQLNNLFKVSQNGGRARFQFSGEACAESCCGAPFDLSPTESLAEAYSETPPILAELAGLPKNMSKFLGNFKNFRLKMDESESGISLLANLAAKNGSPFCESVETMKPGTDFSKVLPAGGTFVIVSKVEFEKKAELEIKLSETEKAAILTDGNFALSASFGASPKLRAVLRAEQKNPAKLRAGKIYEIKDAFGKIDSASGARRPALFLMLGGGAAALSTDKAELEKMLAGAEKLLETRAEKPDIEVFVNSAEPAAADIGIDKRGVSLKISIPYKMLGGYFGAARDAAFRQGANL